MWEMEESNRPLLAQRIGTLPEDSALGIIVSIVLAALPLARELSEWRRRRTVTDRPDSSSNELLRLMQVPAGPEPEQRLPAGANAALAGYLVTAPWVVTQVAIVSLETWRRRGDAPRDPMADFFGTMAELGRLLWPSFLDVLANPLNFAVPFALGAGIWLGIRRLFLVKRLASDRVTGRVRFEGLEDAIWDRCLRMIRDIRARTVRLDRTTGDAELRLKHVAKITLELQKEEGSESYWVEVSSRTDKPTSDSRFRNAAIVRRCMESIIGIPLIKGAGSRESSSRDTGSNAETEAGEDADPTLNSN